MLSLLPTELHYYSMVDVVYALRSVLASTRAQNRIEIPGLGDGIPIRSARAALIVSIKALGIEPGSKIGVPLYCCPVVFKAIRVAGCHPRFLDIDPNTYCVSTEDLREKYSDIDALVAVHMFGNLCEMDGLRRALPGKPIIEDCAQSIGSKLRGQVAGSMGDIAFFSFRLGKNLSAGEGAAIYTGHLHLRKKVFRSMEELAIPYMLEEIKHIFVTYVRSKLRSRPLWGIAGSSIWRIYNTNMEFIDKSPIIMSRMFRSDLTIVKKRMACLDHMIRVQRKNAAYYQMNLGLDPDMMCAERPGVYYNRFVFPLLFRSMEQCDLMRKHLNRRGVSTSKPYEEVISGATANYGYKGDCPEAERLLRRTLIIPSYHNLTAKEMELIVRSVNEGWVYLKNRKIS